MHESSINGREAREELGDRGPHASRVGPLSGARVDWAQANAAGLAHGAAGDWLAAHAAFSGAAQALAEAQGPKDSAALAVVHGNLAQASFHLGRRDEALQHAQNVCTLRVALAGDDTVAVARVRSDLAVMLCRMGRFTEARSSIGSAIRGVERANGDEDAGLIPLLETAARIAMAAREPSSAEPLLLRLHALLAEHDRPTTAADELLARVAKARVQPRAGHVTPAQPTPRILAAVAKDADNRPRVACAPIADITPIRPPATESVAVPARPAVLRATPIRVMPIRETPIRETPIRATPIRETPILETPVLETPVLETPIREAPIREASIREAPIREAPIHATPMRVTPIRVTPIRVTPVLPLRPVQAVVAPAKALTASLQSLDDIALSEPVTDTSPLAMMGFDFELAEDTRRAAPPPPATKSLSMLGFEVEYGTPQEPIMPDLATIEAGPTLSRLPAAPVLQRSRATPVVLPTPASGNRAVVAPPAPRIPAANASSASPPRQTSSRHIDQGEASSKARQGRARTPSGRRGLIFAAGLATALALASYAWLKVLPGL